MQRGIEQRASLSTVDAGNGAPSRARNDLRGWYQPAFRRMRRAGECRLPFMEGPFDRARVCVFVCVGYVCDVVTP